MIEARLIRENNNKTYFESDWVRVPSQVELEQVERALDAINKRSVERRRFGIYKLEVRFVRVHDFDELKQFMADIDRGSTRHSPVFPENTVIKKDPPLYDVQRYNEWRHK